MDVKSTTGAAAAEAARKAAAEAARRAAIEAARRAAMEAAREAAASQNGRTNAAMESRQADSGLGDAFADVADAPEMDTDDPPISLFGLGGIPEVSPRELQAYQALQYMQQLRAQVQGLPPQAVPAISQLLYDPSTFYQQGQAMVGSDYQAQARPEAEAIAGAANGPTLAQRLQEEPNLTTYPEETLNQLASFREAPSPEVQEALDRAAKETLEDDDFDPEKLNPAIAHIIKTSSDPEIKEMLEDKLKDWAKGKLEDSLEGKEKDSGVEDGLGEFQEAIVGLAEKTGLGEELQSIAETTLKDGEGLIEETAKKGRSLWDKFTGAVSGFIDKAFGAIGDGISKAIGAVGDVAKFALDKTGDVWEKGLDLAGAGFDAVGLEGVGNAARKAGDVVDGAYDFVGDQTDNFVDGFGDGIAGTVTGIGSTIAHPIQTVKGLAHIVTHPQDLPKIGKAIWDEASQHGIAGALGYATAQVLPAILSGGSSAGTSLTARLGAVAGKSQVLSTGLAVIKGSKAGQIASKVLQGANYVRQVPGRAINFVAKNTLGKLTTRIGQQPVIRNIAQRIGTSAPVEALKKVQAAIAQRKFDFNTKLDTALAKGVQNLDNTALAQSLQGKLAGKLDDVAGRGLALEGKVAQASRTLNFEDIKAYDAELERLAQQDPTGALVRERHARLFEGSGVSQEKVDAFINEWTSTKARDPFQVKVREDINHVKPLLPKPGEAVDPKLLEGLSDQQRLIFDTLSSRRDRWAALAEELGTPFPEKFDLYRGTSRTDKIDGVLAEWDDPSLTDLATGNRQGGSWSIDPSNAKEYAVGGPREFQYGGDRFTGVTYRAEVPFDDTFVDKFADGSGFAAKGPEIRGQREVVVISPDSSIRVPKENVKLYVGGKEFTYAQRAEARAAWEAIQNAASVNGWAAVAPWLAPAVQAQLEE